MCIMSNKIDNPNTYNEELDLEIVDLTEVRNESNGYGVKRCGGGGCGCGKE